VGKFWRSKIWFGGLKIPLFYLFLDFLPHIFVARREMIVDVVWHSVNVFFGDMQICKKNILQIFV
jgi:hypothetical protein